MRPCDYNKTLMMPSLNKLNKVSMSYYCTCTLMTTFLIFKKAPCTDQSSKEIYYAGQRYSKHFFVTQTETWEMTDRYHCIVYDMAFSEYLS